MNEPKPIREDLVAHIREQIARDPEGYANDAKLKIAADKLLEKLEFMDKEGKLLT